MVYGEDQLEGSHHLPAVVAAVDLADHRTAVPVKEAYGRRLPPLPSIHA
eukprot:CAMPEP_0174731818 /NCGR_PEP_ID=MMETSP1094-20130205/58237_1 /TAXON_ID=156173 /ORGANISM="Chrysochromulina brevifilum, Strain UTEX LB 985" /LENGTH=48 /DNA_ID= /DNA_START= /DNA_END= /DNA_ORIENTATION=